ncbi:hypothetical protein X801_10653 [Opisthorchis viverrini]|uniref:Uncharacterized protein n=1 Tax=Opisthorchis viverrini TaxID=6198 RepID=A0A1S8WGL2_OPIVI|nr:hypothetical protein X801_10653 [Opisthorchis viverrini]
MGTAYNPTNLKCCGITLMGVELECLQQLAPELAVILHVTYVLDESMCVVREDLTDWLQRYLFSTVAAPPIDSAFLLLRLRSGLWLSRLAYKLQLSVLQTSSGAAPPNKPASKDRDYNFLRGAVSNQNLRKPTAPQTRRNIVHKAAQSLPNTLRVLLINGRHVTMCPVLSSGARTLAYHKPFCLKQLALSQWCVPDMALTLYSQCSRLANITVVFAFRRE